MGGERWVRRCAGERGGVAGVAEGAGEWVEGLAVWEERCERLLRIRWSAQKEC